MSGPPPPSFAPGPPSSMPPPPAFAPPAPTLSRDPSKSSLSGEGAPKLEELPSRFYKVNFAYPNEANDEDTLTLRVGDILIVLETREDGWWRGQSGETVGLFPVDYCEPVSEAEVKAFIAQNSKKASAQSAGGSAGGAPTAGRAELEREMKELQAEEATLAAQVTKLKEEVAAMKEDAHKLRKKTREELLETFDSLPAALYEIPTFTNIQYDLTRCMVLIERILESDIDHKELLSPAILACSAFVEEAPKQSLAEPKLKVEVDKCVSKLLVLQKFLLDEHANSNVELPRKVATKFETLAHQIKAFTNGDLDTSAPLLAATSAASVSSTAISVASAAGEIATSPRTWKMSETPDGASPREKKKKKKPMTEEEAAAEAEAKEERRKERRRKRAASGAESDPEDGGAGTTSPRKDKDKKIKKEKRNKRATTEGEDSGAEE